MSVRLHHEGTNILIIMAIIMLAVNLPAWFYLSQHYIAIPITISVLSVVLYCLATNFFRSPHRQFQGDPDNVVVSSVDGEVVALEEVFENEYLHRKVIQLSVFMTIFNVHANWYPVDGKVIYTTHHSGRFLSAYLPKSSTENERSTIVIETPHGQQILVRQIAGAIARRIVTYATVGEPASIEDHLGFIKFGSRVDIFLPLGTEVLVKIGDKTTGGITPVARLKP
ncbi:MAG: phosphatidylserine decarboxylase family protein [Muribaculaceae bacterium]|nr:phosphatidylserine decarboxylase family protein [Muribaculaceae bacterium]